MRSNMALLEGTIHVEKQQGTKSANLGWDYRWQFLNTDPRNVSGQVSVRKATLHCNNNNINDLQTVTLEQFKNQGFRVRKFLV